MDLMRARDTELLNILYYLQDITNCKMHRAPITSEVDISLGRLSSTVLVEIC